MPIASPQDEAAVKSIVDAGLDAEIFSFARCMVDDIHKAKDAASDGVVIEIPSSGHIIERAYGWPLERAIDLSIEATLAAKEAGLYTVFFTIDSSRAESTGTSTWSSGLRPRATWTPSRSSTPSAASRRRRSRSGSRGSGRLPDTPLRRTSTTISGSRSRTRSRRCPPASMSSHDGYGSRRAGGEHPDGGAGAGPDDALRRRSRARHQPLLRPLAPGPGARRPHDPFEPAGRRRAPFEVESGIIAGWFHECIEEFPTELFPYHWDEVGQPPARIVYGRAAASLRDGGLEALGIEADEDQMREIVAAIKRRRCRPRPCCRWIKSSGCEERAARDGEAPALVGD